MSTVSYESLHGKVEALTLKVDKILEQTTKTNGNVIRHESWLSNLAKDVETLEAKGEDYHEAVNSIKAWLKGLIVTGSALLMVLGFVGWLLSNDYLSIHLPACRVQTLNSTNP